MIKRIGAALALLAVMPGCSKAPDPEPRATAPEVPVVAPVARTEALQHGTLVNAAFWQPPGSAEVLVLGAASLAGLEIYAPDGTRLGMDDSFEAGMVLVIDDFPLDGGDGGRVPLVIAYDATRSQLRALRLDRARLEFDDVSGPAIAVADEVTGLCGHRSRLSAADYVYAVTDAGMIHQYELYAADGKVAARLLRSIPSGKGSGFCAVDPRDAYLYIGEEATGVWRLGAEPESDTTREPVDLREPFGRLGDDLKGLAIYPVDAETSYLLLGDVAREQIAVYRLPDGERLGNVAIEGLVEAEGMALTTSSTIESFTGGALAIADEDQGGAGSDLKLLAWRDIAATLNLATAATGEQRARTAAVRPTQETDVIPTYGDSADDPAIWVNPQDPAQSLVIGTGKKSGLYVFDLDGRTVQVLLDGRLNNVDLRGGFPLAGESVTLVTATNRSNDSIVVYAIDPATRRLYDVADGVLPTGFSDPYGLCMYRSGSGDYYVFANEGSDGAFRQWRLADNGSGKVKGEVVRDFAVGSQAEGCVADDELGHLYIAEEDVGVWRYSADADGGDARTVVDSTDASGNLTDDVEGLSLYLGDNGRGYLIVSNQGKDNYAIYRREGDNDYIGHVHVVANAALGIDGASETDGLDVSSSALGDAFPSGLMVVQDGRNIAPEERQNFKYVSWADIADALGLE